MAFIHKLLKIRMLSRVFFLRTSHRTDNGKNRFRRYYYQPRCVVDYDIKCQRAYFGSFCALERCVHPYCNCKDCSYSINTY